MPAVGSHFLMAKHGSAVFTDESLEAGEFEGESAYLRPCSVRFN